MANRTLPDEVIVDGILVRLPTKIIGRFRCVSKLWRTSLSSPRFTRAHLKFHTRDGPQGIILALFFRNFSFCTINLANESRIVSRLFNHPSFAGPTDLIGSCHGLLLISHRNESDGNCSLFNPITLENLKIPESGDSRFCNQGLGYDSLLDDYKIISISIKEPFSMRVYSVKMGTWNRLGNSPYEHFRTGGLFFNGSIHWLASNAVEWIIAAFSLAKEEFSELPLPEDFLQSDLEGFLRFTVIGGCLSLMQYLSFGGVINFWMMQEYGAQDSWKKCTITIGKHKYRYLGVLEENEIVFAKCERKLVSYNWRKGSWRDVGEPDIASLDINETASFGESLISPYHGRRVA